MQLEFLEPGGAVTGHLFPTGSKLDVFEIPGHGRVRVSVVDCANLCCFAVAGDLGLSGIEMPTWFDGAAAMHDAVAAMRAQAESLVAAKHGTKPVIALLGFVAAPADAITLAGLPVAAADAELTGRMFSSGQPHRALPLTSALCMSVAAKIPGTTVNAVARSNPADPNIRIATPSGLLTVTSSVVQEGGSWRPLSASVFRTQRRLFDGQVYYVRSAVAVTAMAAE